MNRIIAGILGAAVTALTLAGCTALSVSSDVPAPAPTPGTLAFTDGLLTYVPAPGGASPAALLEGVVSFDNGCLLVAGTPTIFPSDVTSWDGTTLTVNTHEYVVGDVIAVGGGQGGMKLPGDAREKCGDSEAWYASGIASDLNATPGQSTPAPE